MPSAVPDYEGSSHILPDLKDSPWALWGLSAFTEAWPLSGQSLLDHRALYYREMPGWWSAHSGHLRKSLFWGPPGPTPNVPLSGLLLPLQWLDCSPVHTEARFGCVNHHDGGGWLLHPLRCALTLPPEAGKWWVLCQQQTQESRHFSTFTMGVFIITSAAGPPGSSKIQQLSPRFWVRG